MASARYSRNTGYTITTRTARRSTVQTAKRRVKVGPTAAKVIGLVILMILGLVTLTQATNNATNGYSQSDLRKQLSQKNQDIDQLKLDNERAQSLQAVEQSKAKESMTPMKDVQYVDKEQGDVAGVSTAKP